MDQPFCGDDTDLIDKILAVVNGQMNGAGADVQLVVFQFDRYGAQRRSIKFPGRRVGQSDGGIGQSPGVESFIVMSATR